MSKKQIKELENRIYFAQHLLDDPDFGRFFSDNRIIKIKNDLRIDKSKLKLLRKNK